MVDKAASNTNLQLAYQSLYEKGLLTDVTLVAQDGREVRAHKAILAAHSAAFEQSLAATSGAAMLELKYPFKVIEAMARYLYFAGHAALANLGPEETLDLLDLGEECGVTALHEEHLETLNPGSQSRDLDFSAPSLPGLAHKNCVTTMSHPGFRKRPRFQKPVHDFVGRNLLQLLQQGRTEELNTIPAESLPPVLAAACHEVLTMEESNMILRFALEHSQLASTCDLLRESKRWPWGGSEASVLRAPPGEAPYAGPEWRVPNAKSALEGAPPARVVVGEFFEWCIRLDYGERDSFRIVYESATPLGGAARCVDRFPAAMFTWRVIFRGKDVFHEKPVFICFPENVSLHWSTTLPISFSDLEDDDELIIMVSMAENPMLSLILHNLSADLKNTIESEDILNRLPHIEYRCLSSYALVSSHGGGSPTKTAPLA